MTRLAETDRWLGEHVGQLASIAPDREHPTTLSALGLQLLTEAHADELADSWARGLQRVAQSLAENFPDNIFWDLDYLAAHLLDLADIERIGRSCGLIGELQRGFGLQSTIRFRYVHDFSFGFDWARWVARDADNRRTVGPFDVEFLHYLRRRCAELVEQIERDDEKYPKLPPNAERNPFSFSRAPADERKLHQLLANDGLLPVEAWVARGRICWNRDYAAIRKRYADRLATAG